VISHSSAFAYAGLPWEAIRKLKIEQFFLSFLNDFARLFSFYSRKNEFSDSLPEETREERKMVFTVCRESVNGNEHPTQPSTETSTTDELRKYKSLFDDGIITQEDFDAKKKQLMGL